MTRMQQNISLQKGRFFLYLSHSSFGVFFHYRSSLSHLASPSSYSTRFELFIDFIGVIAAIAAGAAQVYFLYIRQDGDTLTPKYQPLMSLLFGNLTQDFVNFSVILMKAQQGIPGYVEQIPEAARNFRHAAGVSAASLVYIGACH